MVPDYYAMLGVESTADRAAIEVALGRQQPVWSAGTRNPKTKHACQSCLDQIPALRQHLLGDPTTRAAYDAELAAARRVELDRKLDALRRRVELRAAKGGLTVSDHRLLREEALRGGLSPSDLERLVEPFPPRPEVPDPEDLPDPPADVLDGVMRRQLQTSLEHLDRRDLYDALGVQRDAPAPEIALRTDAERQRWMRKSQVTAEKTAWLELITLAQAHLLQPGARARYDRTLVLEAEERLVGSIEFALRGLKTLDPGTRAVLLQEGTALGVVPERVEVLIGRACRKLGVTRNAVEGASGTAGIAWVEPTPRLLRCRECSGVELFSQVNQGAGPAPCRHCGASLRWVCPIDRKVHWVDEPKCDCGFRIELREPFVRHFEAAQTAFRVRRYGVATSHLARARELGPNHVGVRKGIEKVQERLAEIERLRTAYELACGRAQPVAAQAALEAWGLIADPASPDWQAASADVRRVLREAAALVVKARSHERLDPSSARALYRRALAIASDLPDAVEGIRRCPPGPPSELTATLTDDRVVLRWSPPAPDGLGPVSYVIRRKAETAFLHPADGVVIGTASGPTFDDTGVVPGTTVSYAVLSQRGEVASVGAVAVGPIFLLGEVRDVRVESRGREVHLYWRPPRGASAVRVLRKRGSPPTGKDDGEPVEALIDQAIDHDVVPEGVYHYTIQAVYRRPGGRAAVSAGVTVAALPHTPAAPPDAPVLTALPDGGVRLRWLRPPRGELRFLRSAHPLACPPGTRLSTTQADALDGHWLPPAGGDSTTDAPPPDTACFYTPLLRWAGVETVGAPAFFARVPDPTGLRADRAGSDRVDLRWNWGPRGDQSLVVYRAGVPPTGPEDPHALVETVGQSEYARLGLHSVRLPPGQDGPWHVAVYALASVDGHLLTSPGHDPSSRTVVPGPGPEVVVSYTFRHPRILTNRHGSVEFHTDPPGADVPPTVLVVHARAVPQSTTDGETRARFPASIDGAVVDLPPGLKFDEIHARIFVDPLAGPGPICQVRLRHPETAPTRA